MHFGLALPDRPVLPSELQLPLEVVPADLALAEIAADFRARHRISLADAFAAAMAKLRKAELVTGDPEVTALEKETRIRWLK
jgi:predicted nucleic acid-binding protein